MANEYYFAVTTDDDKGMPFGPVNKDNMDVSRLIVDFTCWLDPNETITQIANMMIGAGLCPSANIGFGAWQSDYPVNCCSTPTVPPDDTYPLTFVHTAVVNAGKMVEVDVSGGTPGLTYAVSFTVTAGVSFRRRVIDICVAIDQPINPAMVGLGGMYPSFDFPLVINVSTDLPFGFSGRVYVENTTSAPLTVTLPPSPSLGQSVLIKDILGNCATWPITVVGGASTIEDQPTLVMSYNYNWVELSFTNTQWVQI